VNTLSRRRRALLASLASCAAAIPAASLRAIEYPRQDIRIVISGTGDNSKRIGQVFQRQFPGARVISDLSAPFPKQRDLVFVAIGPAALSAVLSKNVEGAILSVFTSSQAYRTILDSAPRRDGHVTAIYAEPSPTDQMQLIASIFKRRVNVAVLNTEKTEHLVPTLRQAATIAGLSLEIKRVGAEDDLNRALNQVSQAAVILAIPDTDIYNVENIRNTLITSYRHNQGVIGFSVAMVKAGALATTYSNIEDIAVQVGELLDDFAGSGRLPAPQFPKYFRTTVNDSVARSLNLVVEDGTKEMARRPHARAS